MNKIEEIYQYLNKNEIDYYVVLSKENSDHTLKVTFPNLTVNGNILMIFSKQKELKILTSSCNSEQVEEFCDLIVYEDKEFDFLAKQMLKELDFKKLLLNYSLTNHLADGLTYGNYKLIEEVYGKDKLDEAKIESTELIEDFKSIKTDEEVALIKDAVDTTLEIYQEVFLQIKVGMSEVEIGDIFIEKLKEKNVVNALVADYAPPMVCIVRYGLGHRGPSKDYIVQPGDIIVFDFSVRKNNFCSDIARSVYIKKEGETKAPDDIQHAFDTVIKAVHTTIETMQVGMKGYEVDAIGRGVIEAGGYPTIPHSVGHQVGLEVHDGGTVLGPLSSNRDGISGIIRENEVYAIEPTVIQKDQKPCFIVEENIVMTKDGAKLLSKPQKELILL